MFGRWFLAEEGTSRRDPDLPAKEAKDLRTHSVGVSGAPGLNDPMGDYQLVSSLCSYLKEAPGPSPLSLSGLSPVLQLEEPV